MTTRLDDKGFAAFVKDHDKTVVDYYTTWCGPCKQMAPVVEKTAAEMPDVKFAKINIEEEDSEGAANKAAVSAVPTFIAYRKGVEVGRLEGSLPPRKFAKWVIESFEE